MPTNTDADILVLGAGASGLMAAHAAASSGAGRVVVLDHAARPGEKLRVCGGGRCNITNTGVTAADYASANPHFAKSALARFGPWDAWAFFSGLGLSLVEEDEGRVFLDHGTRGGALAAEALAGAARKAGADIRLGVPVLAAAREGDGFRVDTDRGALRAARLIVALGGPAWPQLGATALGRRLAEGFGLAVRPLKPGLTPLLAAGEGLGFCRELAGLSLRAGLQGMGLERVVGELLFTHKGVSGPVVLQHSLARPPGPGELVLDFAPDLAAQDLEAALWERPRRRAATALAALLPERLARALAALHAGQATVGELGHGRVQALVAGVKAWRLTVKDLAGFAKAEVCAGGVDTAGLSSKTLEAASAPGLFFCGEVLDVTGRLGGFNLHWAWASGVAVGMASGVAAALHVNQNKS